MTYCKDCRTEFMVAEDDPCPRCGRYLGGARMGQRAEVARPEQPAQSAQAEASEQADQADQVEEQVEQVAQPDAGGWGALRFRAVAWTWWLCVLLNPFAVLLALSFFHGARQGWLAKIVLVMGWSSDWWIHLLPLLVAYRWTVLVGAALGAWAMWQRLRGLGWNGAWSLACLAPWLLVEFMVLRGFAAAVLLTLNSAVVLALGLRWGEVGECVPAHWPQVAWRVVLVMWGMPTLIVVMGMLGFPTSVWVQCVVMMVIVMAVIAILSKTSRRAAEDRAQAAQERARRQARLAQTAQPAAAQQLSASPSAPSAVWTPTLSAVDADASAAMPAFVPAPAPIDELFRPRRATQVLAEDIAGGCASLIARGMLLAVLAIPALFGFAVLAFSQGDPVTPLLWFLYLSVFVPIVVCCVFMPFDVLDGLMRDHPRFCVLWLLWVILAVGLFLWAIIQPHSFRIFLSVFGGGYY